MSQAIGAGAGQTNSLLARRLASLRSRPPPPPNEYVIKHTHSPYGNIPWNNNKVRELNETATNALLDTEIFLNENGKPLESVDMVNFQGESGYGRYYKKSTFNQLELGPNGLKENPTTRDKIKETNVKRYIAKPKTKKGGKRKLTRRRKQRTRKTH